MNERLDAIVNPAREDIEANSAGRLSAAQAIQLEADLGAFYWIRIGICCVVAFMVGTVGACTSQIYVLLIALVLMAVAVGLAFRLKKRRESLPSLRIRSARAAIFSLIVTPTHAFYDPRQPKLEPDCVVYCLPYRERQGYRVLTLTPIHHSSELPIPRQFEKKLPKLRPSFGIKRRKARESSISEAIKVGLFRLKTFDPNETDPGVEETPYPDLDEIFERRQKLKQKRGQKSSYRDF
jgi:hypothetical protein